MPSPFPGMNPYLEQADVWHDFHQSFIPMVRGLLSPQVLPRYYVKIEEHVYILERESYLEVRDLQTQKVICIIELLSPTNKNVGSDREQYRAKRLQYLTSRAHLVEIDLLRGGPRMMERCPECDYCALVSVAEKRPHVALWPIHLTDRLPIIPVPLANGDPPAKLDLQDALHRVYDQAGYGLYMYNRTPEPPLTPEQQEWAKDFLPPARPQ